MKNPYVKTVNSNTTSVLENSVVPIGTTLITGYDKNALTYTGNGIRINDICVNGYKVTVNVTATVPVAGDATLVVMQNGVAIPGATSTETFTTATTQTKTISFETIVKSLYGSTPDIITLYNNGVAITTTNVEFDIEKI